MARPDREELTVRLEPVVDRAVRSAGFELDRFEVHPSGRSRLVKVVVDGDDGLDLDDVAKVSRALSVELDAHDELLGGPYRLEVSSPGVDRPLTRPRHWRRARLRLVRVRLVDGEELLGRVGPADDTGVVLLVDGLLRSVRHTEVARATMEVEFHQPPADELRVLAAADGEALREDTK